MPKKRNNNKQKVRKRILILAEGETELIYFRAIKHNIHLKNKLTAARIVPFDTDKNTGKELIDVAKQLKREAQKEQNPYDALFVVLDKDGYTKHPETFNKARDNKINVSFSSISFEYWYLLHFEYTTRAFINCDELIDYLKTYVKDYDKTADYYESHLNEQTNKAIVHAKRVRDFFQNDIDRGRKIYELDCYTDIDILMEYLITL